MKRQGWMRSWALAAGLWLAATPAGADDKRREPQRCEERCDDETQRCREICKKFAGDNDACFKACSDEGKRCTQQCKESARR